MIVSSGQQMYPFSLKLTTAFKHLGFSFLTLNSTLNIVIPVTFRYLKWSYFKYLKVQYNFSQMEKGNILVMWKNKTKYHLMEYTEKNRASFLLYSCEGYITWVLSWANMHEANLNCIISYRRTGLYFSKFSRSWKKRRNSPRLKSIKETWQLSVMCAPGLDLFVIRDIIGITGKTEWSLRIWC